MKITKRELKKLLKEQIEKVFNEAWIDVEKEELPLQSLAAGEPEGRAPVDIDALTQLLRRAREAYDPDEPDSVFSVVEAVDRALEMIGGEDPDAEWMADEEYQRQQDWPPEPEEEEPEEPVLDLRKLEPSTRRKRARLRKSMRQHSGQEPVDIGMPDPRTGRLRVSESQLKQIIKEELNEKLQHALRYIAKFEQV